MKIALFLFVVGSIILGSLFIQGAQLINEANTTPTLIERISE